MAHGSTIQIFDDLPLTHGFLDDWLAMTSVDSTIPDACPSFMDITNDVASKFVTYTISHPLSAAVSLFALHPLYVTSHVAHHEYSHIIL